MKTTEGGFEILNNNNIGYSQGISHYEHFLNLDISERYKLIIMPLERDSVFVAYWQGLNKLNEDSQQIYLQLKDKVIEYNFPLHGRINLSDLERNKVQEFIPTEKL